MGRVLCNERTYFCFGMDDFPKYIFIALFLDLEKEFYISLY